MDRLCFGTSTFVAGRLLPDKDSQPGIAAMAAALRLGVRQVHSNPKLGTQWAIRKAVDAAGCPSVRHLIKIEMPVEVSPPEAADLVDAAALASAASLSVDEFDAAVVELDLKRSVDRRRLVEPDAVASFYATAAQAVAATGRFGQAIAYCHSPAHLAASMWVDGIAGHGAQFNRTEAWPLLYLDRLREIGQPFIAMAPLRRGRLVDVDAPTPASRLDALRWAVAHPGVTSAVITMSSVDHLMEVIDAVSHPEAIELVKADAETWRDGHALNASRPDSPYSPPLR